MLKPGDIYSRVNFSGLSLDGDFAFVYMCVLNKIQKQESLLQMKM